MRPLGVKRQKLRRAAQVKAGKELQPLIPTVMLLWMDEIHFAPAKNPWNGDSSVDTNQQWISSTDSMNGLEQVGYATPCEARSA